MYIERDIIARLKSNAQPAQLVIGPRQCGKSTLLSHVSAGKAEEISFDDFALRELANRDPALFFEQFVPPLILDEIQYVPALFPEIKKRIDVLKKARLQNNAATIPVLFRMTGSNQWLLDTNVKESLVGRASYFYLNTLTVHEIIKAFPKKNFAEILFAGGMPEYYINADLLLMQYLNDYIHSYIEKEVMLTMGIQKQASFSTLLRLLAARTGMLLDYTSIGNEAGIAAVTVKEWVGVLAHNQFVHCLQPYANNLNKRLIKTPKCYFFDTGIAARLQGWQSMTPMLVSPQVGALFETLVFAEIFKFIQNYGKDWQLYFWRTKDGEEIDFVIITANGCVIPFDAKMSVQRLQPMLLPPAFKTLFKDAKPLVLVTAAGNPLKLSENCISMPITHLHDWLLALE